MNIVEKIIYELTNELKKHAAFSAVWNQYPAALKRGIARRCFHAIADALNDDPTSQRFVDTYLCEMNKYWVFSGFWKEAGPEFRFHKRADLLYIAALWMNEKEMSHENCPAA